MNASSVPLCSLYLSTHTHTHTCTLITSYLNIHPLNESTNYMHQHVTMKLQAITFMTHINDS